MSKQILWPLVALVLIGCSRGDDANKVVLTGSSTVAPLMSEIAKRFEQIHPGVRVDVQTGGSSRGIADARNGVAQIGMVSRALKESEDDLTAHTIAKDGLALIVHEENPVNALSDEQILSIYRGQQQDWGAFGGEGPITVVHKAEGRSTLEIFLKHFKLKNDEVKPSVIIGDNEQGIKVVSGNKGAIAYVSVGVAEVDIKKGAPLRALPVSGIAATTANVRAGTFPILRELNLVTKGQPTGKAKALIEFALSDDVKDILASQAVVAP